MIVLYKMYLATQQAARRLFPKKKLSLDLSLENEAILLWHILCTRIIQKVTSGCSKWVGARGVVASPLLYWRTCVSQCCAVAVARYVDFLCLGNVKILLSYKFLVLITILQQLSIRKLALCRDPKKPIQCNEQKRYEHLGLFMVGLFLHNEEYAGHQRSIFSVHACF